MDYEKTLKDELKRAYAHASEARAKGYEPEREVEVKITADIAARVEKIVGPRGIAKMIRDAEKEGKSREDSAFEIARAIALGHICKGNKEELIEQAIRTGTAILTEGVLVAPTEGIAKVKIRKNPDGSDYIAIYYAGPIRSAGGTAVALTVVLGDIARRAGGVGDYRATDTQIERYVEEVNVYEARVSHLQYKPPEEDVRWIVSHCPVCIDGEPTEDIEVSAYRSVPGVETNRIRGGIPLVLCEGIAQKAAKLLRYTKKFNLGWEWLERLIKIKRKESTIELKPDDNYLDGLVAGRPVFCHPSAKGGFRLRYGKSRTNGMMAKNIHPATMVLLGGFLTYGTHMKIERPGKGCVVTPNDVIEGPVVRLKDGSVVKVDSEEEAMRLLNDVDSILFLGDMLVTYGDFLKSNHPLVPPAWCEEWFERELDAKGLKKPDKLSVEEAFMLSKAHGIPLHPAFTYHWHDISPAQLKEVVSWLASGKLIKNEGKIKEMVLENSAAKNILEELLVPHHVADGMVILDNENATALLLSLGMLVDGEIDRKAFDSAFSEKKSTLEIVNETSGITIKAKAPTYIGARMGRPEKAKERRMDGSPHVLFPTGSQKNRSLMKIYRMLSGRKGEKTITLELSRRRCNKCGRITSYARCEWCGGETVQEYFCQKCNKVVTEQNHCNTRTIPFENRAINLVEMFEKARKIIGTMPVDVKGVKGLSNHTRTPELLEKGLLRAKHDVYVFKDGTIRFDATNIPLTHFYPKEIGLSVEMARKLGYDKDWKGNPLEDNGQLVVLKPQDIIISESGGDYFLRVARFIDDMLVNLHGVKAFYNAEKKADLIGHLCVSLSPHTSAAVLCRIIGFTKANGGYAHPFMIAARRRNCFHGDERLLVHNGSGFELLTIRELVERNLNANTQKDDFGTEYKRINGMKTFAFNRNTKEFELADITHISKHPAPKKLLKIKTKSGRKIVVTADHPFPDSKGSKIKAENANELLIPWKINAGAIAGSRGLGELSDNETLFQLGSYLADGRNAKLNMVPDFVYSLPKDKISAFLRGYFHSGGYCSLQNSLEVSVTSVNKFVIDGLSFLLMFLGIKHSIQEEKMAAKKINAYKIIICGKEAKKFIEEIGLADAKQEHAKELLKKWLEKKGEIQGSRSDGEVFIDPITDKEVIDNKEEYVYNLTVDEHHTLICSGVTAFQCDGDEDSTMLLMDALLNFSRHYLDEKRGGTMDVPLILTPIINPAEIDDEAHCIEYLSTYQLDFYNAAERLAMPAEVKMRTVKDVLGTADQYSIPLTHLGCSLDKGNVRSAYVQLNSIPEKIRTQFKVQTLIRAVDSKNAAERLILSHFIPDLYGNLRSFSRQSFRCVNCNKIYRRVPLAGKCLSCGGNLLLTINKGGIEKYLQISRDIVEEYELPLYLKQRLELLEKEINAVFEDEKAKQLDLSDFV